MWKKRLTVGVLIVILCVSGFYVYFVKNFGFESHLPQVIGVPPDKSISQKSYTGAPPATLIRPADPFDYPIPLGKTGPVEPLFAGPLQYPFLCHTEESNLGQPLVDNQEKIGIPVYAEDEGGNKTNEIIGYSKDCSLPTQAYYFYNREGTEDFFPLSEAKNDIAQAELEGQTVDFIVRVEVGTINRFIYVISALKGTTYESLARPSNAHWNERLIYQFRGGVGIGKRQGRVNVVEQVLKRRYAQLRRGYAVAYSTGNQTSNHYNIWLAEDTALRVKRQFAALYGKPLYTVGVGGSGGAIQQYLIAQNNPALLDAAIAIYAYPDMVTQTIHVLDCELLEYFFDVLDADNPKWKQWKNRQWIEGMNASDEVENKYGAFFAWAKLLKGVWPSMPTGTSECVNSWRGLTPLIHNPHYVHFYQRYASSVVEQTHWTYWDDMKHFYGINEWGYARNTWDNVGVQYGLEALKAGFISPAEFLKLNAFVGGWKQPHEMTQERYWFLVGQLDPRLSPWGEHNRNLSPDGQQPATRTTGDVQAMRAAYRSGNVFTGQIQIPVIDVRHYLDPKLDMHHLSASFSARQRIIQAQGHANQQLIWVAEKPYNPVDQAFEQLDPWLLKILLSGKANVVATKPENMVDRCFDKEGNVIAEGEKVWDGDWNHQPVGDCMKKFPAFTTSRGVAGDNIAGSTFKCTLQSVKQALESGIYGNIAMQPYLERLTEIFPDGVCDYTQPDQGQPN